MSIFIKDGEVVSEGYVYTLDQIQHALDCAYRLALTYALADPENGGGGYIDWEDINGAHEEARMAFDIGGLTEIDQEAQAQNKSLDAEEVIEELSEPPQIDG